MNVDLNIKSNTKTKRGEIAMEAVMDNSKELKLMVKGNVKLLYSVKETSEVLGVSKHCVYDLINKGLLPALKLGSLKIRRETLENFVKDIEGKDLSDLDNICVLQVGGQ